MSLLIVSVLMLLLPECTRQSCTEGKPKECLEAEFAPGTNLAGEGFDITKMEYKGSYVIDMNKWKRKDKTCTLCTNPFMDNKKQKVPLSVLDWRAKQLCSAKVSGQLHTSSESLISSSSSFTEIKGGHTTEPDLMFSADKDPSAYKEWLTSLPQHPDIISYSLDSLHELLPPKTPSHKQLRTAISHYILERGLWRNCSTPCSAGVKTDPRDPCVCQCHNNAAVNQNCCPTQRGLARVIITVQRASGLWGDSTTATDGYVKVFRGETFWRSIVVSNNNNPHFGYVIDWGNVNLLMVNKVRFEVWDQDILTPGVKQDMCFLNHGQLFFKLDVVCAPSLGGNSCSDYKASPMSKTLEGWFRSRHAHPVPKALLQEWGVFMNVSNSNQTRV
uniref:C2 domain-containing protein n=1 Tax=Neogobius melanostomus TaxID=47308 RepID=A0A8C6UM47_9GOBI